MKEILVYLLIVITLKYSVCDKAITIFKLLFYISHLSNCLNLFTFKRYH